MNVGKSISINLTSRTAVFGHPGQNPFNHLSVEFFHCVYALGYGYQGRFFVFVFEDAEKGVDRFDFVGGEDWVLVGCVDAVVGFGMVVHLMLSTVIILGWVILGLIG